MTKKTHDISNKKESVESKDDKAPTLKQTMASVGSAMIGIQSNKNRERDFSQGKFSHFVIAGVLAVVLFISALIFVVSLVLPD